MYIILDEDVRRKFEETYQIPYGYGDGNCYIYENLDDAISDYREVAEPGIIIENYDKGYRDTIYSHEDLKDLEDMLY
jgi:hypothetical protein